MPDLLGTALSNLLTPMVLSFVLGVLAGAARSDLEIPEALSKGMAIFLMFAIGLKGGASLDAQGVGTAFLATAVAAVALSFLLPFAGFALLRMGARLNATDAAAVSAHYGSISIVTFVTATEFLRLNGVAYDGSMIAVAALMETPAIISGLLLAQWFANDESRTPRPAISSGLMREVFVNGSVVLLLGGFVIGWLTGKEGLSSVSGFFEVPFQGVLCLFLLDMGLLIARRASGFKILTPGLFVFGVGMPLLGAICGMAVGKMLGLSIGSATLFAVLGASASYIAVPAAMRLALPRANPTIYVTLSLAVTFPFNVVIGIPAYHAVVDMLYR